MAPKRTRSSSLPSATARPAVQNHILDKPIVRIPHALRTVADAQKSAQFSPLSVNGHIGPKHRKRAVSDPLTYYSPDIDDGDTLCGSRDDDASWTDENCIEDPWEGERNKDALRRFHALKELLATEVGYLADLRFLVTVYLRNLPTIVARSLSSTSAFGRASASLAVGSLWMYSHSAPSSSSALSDSQTTSESSSCASFNSRHSRFVFTDHEIELLTRNGEVLLQLHEHFVGELRMMLEPLGLPMGDDKTFLGLDQSSSREILGRFQLGDLNEAIRIVSTKFATEASRFNAYQSFCAGHPEAMDVLRKAFQQFPLELESFEQRCSSIVSSILENGVKPACSEPVHNKRSSAAPSRSLTAEAVWPPMEDRKRAVSLTSLDGGKMAKSKSPYSSNSLRPRASMTAMTMISMMGSSSREKERDSSKDDNKAADICMSTSLYESQPAGAEAVAGELTTSQRDRDKDKSSSSVARKIVMADYMIKPVQRICKYPLLLDQLLPSKALRAAPRKLTVGFGAGVEVVVESAAQAMRHVATSVNEARDRHSIAIQSSLIFSRICLGLQVQRMPSSASTSVSHSSHPSTPPSTYNTPSSLRSSPLVQTQAQTQSRLPTPTFLTSLGPCLLSGSLDVMHYSRALTAWSVGSVKAKMKIKAKYFGAFLYSGGYLILVKVGKGKRYEPRHWFSLSGWDVVRVDEEDAVLPNSFRLSKADQHFELAASCQREQDVWLNCIREALSHVPAWSGEPLPSFMSHAIGSGKGDHLVMSVSTQSASTSEDGHVPIELAVASDDTGADSGRLPTILSIPEVFDSNAPDAESVPTTSEPFFTSLRGYAPSKTKKRKESEAAMTVSVATTLRPRHSAQLHPQLQGEESFRPQSRRSSSSTSVKNIFTPISMTSLDREKDKESEPDTVLVTRSSATARQAVDSELQDVMSVICTSVRAETAWREKGIVGVGAMWGSTRAKTSASVGMGSVGRGMARLSKHESVRVPRKRASMGMMMDGTRVASSPQPPGKKSTKTLSLAPTPFNEYGKSSPTVLEEVFTPVTATTSPDTSRPLAHPPSSRNVMIDVVSSASPALLTPPPPANFNSSPSEAASQLKPARSFVRNVKGFFHFRPISPAITSPVSVIISQPSQSSLPSLDASQQNATSSRSVTPTNTNYAGPGLLQCFVKDSHRRRSKNLDLEKPDVITITSICEDNEDLGEKFSIVAPIARTAPLAN